MNSILGGVLIPDGKRFVSSVDVNLTAVVLFPGGVFVSGNKRNKEVDINHFHMLIVSFHLVVVKAIAQQHGTHLVGKLAPCSGCLQAKRARAATLHQTPALLEQLASSTCIVP